MAKQHLNFKGEAFCGYFPGEKMLVDNPDEVDCARCLKKLERLGDEFVRRSRIGIGDIASPDAETEINEAGGKQSHIPVRFDLIDAKALFEQAKVLHEGAVKYGENNWRLIPVEDHLNHLIMHAYAYLAGDRTDEHLSHIMCRATFAQGVAIEDMEGGNQ